MDAKFYVPYETARELRLKGYPQSTDTWYVEPARGVRIFKNQTNKEFEYIARPTYHEVLDWLEEHGWYVSVGLRLRGGVAYVSEAAKILWRPTLSCGAYRTREGALNAAILETLKRIYI